MLQDGQMDGNADHRITLITKHKRASVLLFLHDIFASLLDPQTYYLLKQGNSPCFNGVFM